MKRLLLLTIILSVYIFTNTGCKRGDEPANVVETSSCEYDHIQGSNALYYHYPGSNMQTEMENVLDAVGSTYLNMWKWKDDKNHLLDPNYWPTGYFPAYVPSLTDYAILHKNYEEIPYHFLSVDYYEENIPGNLINTYINIPAIAAPISPNTPPEVKWAYVFVKDIHDHPRWSLGDKGQMIHHSSLHEIGHQIAGLTHSGEEFNQQYHTVTWNIDPEKCIMGPWLPNYDLI